MIGGESLPYPLTQNLILGKKGGSRPKLGKNSTNLDFAQTFRVTSGQKNCDYGENLPHPPKPKLDFRQKRGRHPKSGKNSTNDLAQTFSMTTHCFPSQ